jgi:hypothetical protein
MLNVLMRAPQCVDSFKHVIWRVRGAASENGKFGHLTLARILQSYKA